MSDYQYAGFWLRFVANFIDNILMVLIALAPAALMGFPMLLGVEYQWTTDVIQEAVNAIIGICYGLALIIYFPAFESSIWQATPGKKLLNLIVTDLNGERIGFGKASVRLWSKLISALILYIGFLMVAFTQKKQGLHDKFAGTLVIKNKRFQDRE